MKMKFEERNLIFDLLIDYKAKLSAQLVFCKNEELKEDLERQYEKTAKAIDLLTIGKVEFE